MYSDYNEEHLRKQIKQRYNRRFFLIAHVGVLVMIYIASLIVPALNIVATVTLLALIPHLLYVAYQEYRVWVELRVEQELYEQEAPYYDDTEKRKRYADEYDAYAPEVRYELTDDGELEPIPHSQPYSDKQKRKAMPYNDTDHKPRYHRKSRAYDERKERKKSRKRRKYDTDEFDLKKIVKKIIDIVD